ncbi:MAG: DUF523 and DUF1722 domain-containing protein [Myxococcota bacterium]|nr:DUF523 and DUF1722 domain-containing protein [Myxococcota bacterium]
MSQFSETGRKPTPISVGVSACILGHLVRFDGGHKRDRFVHQVLNEYLDFVPVCPEVEIGLPIPRATLRLVEEPRGGAPRLYMPKTDEDYTSAMESYATSRVKMVDEQGLCGFIVQAKSPSCGMERVRVYGAQSQGASRSGRGVFTRVLMATYPSLPVEEVGRLNDWRIRDNFLTRVYAFQRLRSLFDRDWTLGELVAFHAREKCLLMAHHLPTFQALGRLVASAKGRPPEAIEREYTDAFMAGLTNIVQAGHHMNVLSHCVGHFKQSLDRDDRQEMVQSIERYRAGGVPLVAPMTLLRHHVRKQGVTYLAKQTYFDPYPSDLRMAGRGAPVA